MIDCKKCGRILLGGFLGVYGVLATVICGVYIRALIFTEPFLARDPRPSILVALLFVSTAGVLAFTTAYRLWKSAANSQE